MQHKKIRLPVKMLKDTEKPTQKRALFRLNKKQKNRIKYKFLDKKTHKSTTIMGENESQQLINELCETFKNADHDAQGELLAKITEEIE